MPHDRGLYQLDHLNRYKGLERSAGGLSKEVLKFNLDVYLYLQCLSLHGAVTVIVLVRLNQNSITQKMVLNSHQVPQAGGGSL